MWKIKSLSFTRKNFISFHTAHKGPTKDHSRLPEAWEICIKQQIQLNLKICSLGSLCSIILIPTMTLGEIFLTAFIDLLFNKLTSAEFLHFVRQEGLHTKLKKLEKTLQIIRAALIDAEEKQITESTVKSWLEDLRDLAYDMDDLLDELATEALRRKLMADGSQATAMTTAVQALIPACFTISFNPSALMFSARMGPKIKEITNRVKEIAALKIDLGLQENPGGRCYARERLPTTSLVDESRVYGRDEDKMAILNQLLKDEASENEISVIPIVGMPGVGKTTLANLA